MTDKPISRVLTDKTSRRWEAGGNFRITPRRKRDDVKCYLHGCNKLALYKQEYCAKHTDNLIKPTLIIK